MPTYDYVCTKCGHEMEVFHPVHGHGPSACPQCGGQMRKAFAPPAVVFKGTGWARKERAASHRKRSGAESEGGKSADEKPKTDGAGSGDGSSRDKG